MSSAIEVAQATSEQNRTRWGLWLRQVGAIFRLEIQKNLLGRRSILIYLIALLPLFPLALLALVTPPGNEWRDFNQYSVIYSIIYNGLILRTLIFFGSAWIFMNLFRGELVDRSLHYYFLSAVRREVLVVGKYLSGLVTSIVLFTTTTVIAMLLLYFPHLLAERALLYRGSRSDAASDLRRHHDTRVRRLRRFLPGRWTVRSQSDHSGAGALRLGVAQLPSAAAAEKSQRDSLSQLTRPGAAF